MDLRLNGIVALTASALTFFSGFGRGTIMVPAFSLVLPIPVAVAAAALVHVPNNLLKFGLMARRADWRTVVRIGLPAAVAALAGALLRGAFARMPVLIGYETSHGLDSRIERLLCGATNFCNGSISTFGCLLSACGIGSAPAEP